MYWPVLFAVLVGCGTPSSYRGDPRCDTARRVEAEMEDEVRQLRARDAGADELADPLSDLKVARENRRKECR